MVNSPTIHDPDMAPEASPSGVSAGTRRINAMPIVIIFIVLVIFGFVMVGVIYSRKQNQLLVTGEKITGASKQADSVIPKVLTWIDAKVAEPVPVAVVPILPPIVPSRTASPAPDPVDQARLQALQTAFGSKPAVDGIPLPKQSTAAEDKHDPQMERLAMLRSILGTDGKSSGAASSAQPDIAGLRQPDATDPNRWKINTSIENPTKFMLRTGAVIPGVLISGINSELPGTIIAQISQNVYDTPTGRYLLLPQGSRIVGSYAADVQYGQDRVFITWQRIIYPDGRALDIGSQPGTDGGGSSGFADKVNHHYIKTFGSAILMSAVVGGVSYSQNATQNNNGSVYDRNYNQNAFNNNLNASLSQSLGNVFGNAIGRMIEKNLNIAPTVTIRPGFRFNILVIKDFPLTPYKDFQYTKMH